MLRRKFLSVLTTTLGFAYLTNWLTDTGKDVLINVFHINPITALILVIALEKSPELTRSLRRELGAIRIPKFGIYTALKEIFIALSLYLQTENFAALTAIPLKDQHEGTEYSGGKIKICKLKRCLS